MRFSLPSIKCSAAPPSFQLRPRTRYSTPNSYPVIRSLCTVHTMKQCSVVVGSWEKPPNIWLTVAKNAFVGWALNFRVHVLMKGAVKVFFLHGNKKPWQNSFQWFRYKTISKWRGLAITDSKWLEKDIQKKIISEAQDGGEFGTTKFEIARFNP